MRTAIVATVAAASLALLGAPSAPAVPNCGYSQSCQPRPWNGPLMPTWDTPGYYGG